MWIRSVRVVGHAASPSAVFPALERVDAIEGVAATAVAEGLALVSAYLVPDTCTAALADLDLLTSGTVVSVEDGRVDEVAALSAEGAAAVVGHDAPRHLIVHLDLELDPPTFGMLRDQAGKDPRLVGALGTHGLVHLRIGWLFNRLGSHASPAALALHIGEERFQTQGPDRPAWLPTLLDRVGAALRVRTTPPDLDTLTRALHDAALSADPRHRAAYLRAAAALAAPPFSLGGLQIVQQAPDRLRLALGDDLHPLRWAGPDARAAVALVHTVLVDQPDILVLDEPAQAGWTAWLTAQVEGDDATVEQVLTLQRGATA